MGVQAQKTAHGTVLSHSRLSINICLINDGTAWAV